MAEARWLAEAGVRELMLVSENSTSYGKDLGNLRLLEELLPDLAATSGIERVRVSYLQPAELRPGCSRSSRPRRVWPLLRPVVPARQRPGAAAMRRFGDRERFLALLDQIRELSRRPASGLTSSSAPPARPRLTCPSSSFS